MWCWQVPEQIYSALGMHGMYPQYPRGTQNIVYTLEKTSLDARSEGFPCNPSIGDSLLQYMKRAPKKMQSGKKRAVLGGTSLAIFWQVNKIPKYLAGHNIQI